MGGVEKGGNWKKVGFGAVGLGAGLLGASKLYGAYKAAEAAKKMQQLNAPLQMISLF
ncbi:MAG: hypothetical protein RLZZ86_98 [Cyanobacteriota bacterium]|jgi:hypothetical protein